MFRRIFLAAVAAGLISGGLVTGVQSVTTTPLILHAETFEGSGGKDGHSHGASAGDHHLRNGAKPAAPESIAPAAGEPEGWTPADGIERTLYTALANMLLGVGFALLIVAGMALSGRPVTTGIGVLWGAAGFVAFTLAPGLGLPPELPGTMAAELGARQLWWVCAVSGAALGLGLMVFTEHWKGAGLLVLVLPHLVGAPHPASMGGAVPPELSAHFAAASIVVSAVFWTLTGGFCAWFWRRFETA